MKATFPMPIYADHRVHICTARSAGEMMCRCLAMRQAETEFRSGNAWSIGIRAGHHERRRGKTKPMRPHFSGGGWNSGCEDPRLTLIDRVYLTYTAFDGWGSIRIALSLYRA